MRAKLFIVCNKPVRPAAGASGWGPLRWLRRWSNPRHRPVSLPPLNRFRLYPSRRLLSLLLVAGVALAMAGLVVWRRSTNERHKVMEGQTAPVIRRDLDVNVSATGSIRPLTPVNISPKQPGRILVIAVDQGERVKAGQLLARMDDSNLRGELLRAQGILAAAQANLTKMETGSRPEEIREAQENLHDAEAQMIAIQSAFRSNQRLYQAGAIGRVSFDSSRSQYLALQEHIHALRAQLDLVQAGFRKEDIAAARASVMQAEGTLQTIRTQIADTYIRAPFPGVITQKYADIGAFVTPTTSASATSSATSSSIFALAGALEGVANVAETDIASIYRDQPVSLQVDAFPGHTFHGRVRLVAPESVVVQNVTSFQVRIHLDDPDRDRLLSGMNFTANFRVGRHPKALLIPTSAIVSQREGLGVYVLGPRQKPLFRPIRVGATVGTQSEVLDGLNAGEHVLLTFPGRRPAKDRPVRSNSPFQQPQGAGRMR
jgi:HlyD family secretion protein